MTSMKARHKLKFDDNGLIPAIVQMPRPVRGPDSRPIRTLEPARTLEINETWFFGPIGKKSFGRKGDF